MNKQETLRIRLSDLYFKHYKATPQEIADCVQAKVEAELHIQSLRKYKKDLQYSTK